MRFLPDEVQRSHREWEHPHLSQQSKRNTESRLGANACIVMPKCVREPTSTHKNPNICVDVLPAPQTKPLARTAGYHERLRDVNNNSSLPKKKFCEQVRGNGEDARQLPPSC